jgi:hypothetical protein
MARQEILPFLDLTGIIKVSMLSKTLENVLDQNRSETMKTKDLFQGMVNKLMDNL